jgi:hypothetical protein
MMRVRWRLRRSSDSSVFWPAGHDYRCDVLRYPIEYVIDEMKQKDSSLYSLECYPLNLIMQVMHKSLLAS